jgi:hypothetical protein
MKTARPSGFHKTRRTRNWTDYNQDPYRKSAKLSEPTVCPDCGAVLHEGRWRWQQAAPPESRAERCPACQRIHDQYPAGYVTLSGPFFASHREDILNVVRNHEAREKAEHPLQRIMKLEDQQDHVLVTTTDAHLARGIGEAVQHAYHGEFAFQYGPEDNVIRVSWSR